MTYYWGDAATVPLGFGVLAGGYGASGYPLPGVVQNNQLSGNYYQRLTTTRSWLSTRPSFGEVPAQTSLTTQVCVDADGLAEGVHSGSVLLRTNDLAHPIVPVPVQLITVCNDFDRDGTTDCAGDCNDHDSQVFLQECHRQPVSSFGHLQSE